MRAAGATAATQTDQEGARPAEGRAATWAVPVEGSCSHQGSHSPGHQWENLPPPTCSSGSRPQITKESSGGSSNTVLHKGGHPQTCSISITWEPAHNAGSQTAPQSY